MSNGEKKKYKKKIKESELISEKSKEEASKVLENLEIIHEKINKKDLLEKKNAIITKIDDLNDNSILD